MPLKKPQLVCAASKGQHLQKVEKFKYLGVIYTSDARRNKVIKSRTCIVKQPQFRVIFIAKWSQNGSFKHRKAVSF